MRRFVVMVLCLLLMAGVLVMPASADNGATKVESIINVTPTGDCMVSTTVRLNLDTPVESLTFPLPPNATDITMNNGSPRVTETQTAQEVDLSRSVGGMVGEINLMFNYNIPGAVKPIRDEDGTVNKTLLNLELPLLNSFALPVQELSFVVTLPENIKYYPTFTSIYQLTGIEASLDYRVDQKMLTGHSIKALNDHEGITMNMAVPVEMFPTVSTYIREGNPEVVPMLICGGLAMVYWILFLRTLPLVRRRSVSPPEGITAGELGCHLTLAGGDLTMMVFHWAQMGYILIHRDGGRVMLHKRMDMGNERSPFEVKVFKMLFGSRRSIDATSYQYAKMSRKVFAMIPGERELCSPRSGNTKIFRALACGIHIFCGICIAMNMASARWLQILLSVILVVFGAVSAWQIHEIAYRTHLRGKTRVYVGLVCCLIWIVLGVLCGQWVIPLCAVLAQFAIGYLAAYGGRRTEVGRYDAGHILGLRSYLKKVAREDITRMMRTDPEYFFNMAPFALALGIIHPFARNFGSIKLPQCPYLVTKLHGMRTAEEWAELMADTADRIDARYRRMEIEKWLPRNPR